MVKYKKAPSDRILQALANPTRREILDMVADRDRQASEYENFCQANLHQLDTFLNQKKKKRAR
jgi:DNA-binding transcriptional ArsR family regulator